ncbi:MAG: 4Fe-4S dicluster domain-containing protein [Bacteroidales bacterium]|nr:4Fe-4S dicluster domain-containing protein [Bacteroidales bacterium]
MSNRLEPLYTEKNNCQDCYKCIKECPVKSIKIENTSASIRYEYCTYCGHCLTICPANAKKLRDDTQEIITALQNKEQLIISLAPSYISEFPNVNEDSFIAAAKEMGFYGVSETALGAEKVSKATKEWLKQQPQGVYISSCCTAAVHFICKYYPEKKHLLAPIDTPMVAHAKMLKKHYPNCKVVFVGPCVAKKKESDMNDSIVDYVLTYKEFVEMMDWFGVDFDFTNPTEDDVFIPQRANKGRLFPVDGGMIANMIKSEEVASINNNNSPISYMTFSGVKNIKEIIEDADRFEISNKLFLELMICEGGCIKGPGTLNDKSVASKRIKVFSSLKKEHPLPTVEENLSLFDGIDVSTSFDSIAAPPVIEYPDAKIEEALQSVNKFSKQAELNCSGCGYDNCREFAKALIDGRAESSMCISFMRSVAFSKTNILLRKIPYGVVIVDENMQIVDSNEKFINILGEEAQFIHENVPNLVGADARKLIPFSYLFEKVLKNGTDQIEQDVRYNDKYLNVSVMTVQSGKTVCGIVQNMHEPEVRKDLVINRTREVILRNLKVVQQIAFLLGENASFTETMLNSIVESHDEIKK